MAQGVPRLGDVKAGIGYIRTSKKGEGQDPDRQAMRIWEWARANGIKVGAIVRDVGTSAYKVPPLDREALREAAAKCGPTTGRALVVSEVSRFSRRGPREFWAAVQTLQNQGVVLLTTRFPKEEQRGPEWELQASVQAALAYQEAHILSERVKSGQAQSDASPGRPRRELSSEEIELAEELQLEEGKGLRQITHRINQDRGVFEIADADTRDKKRLSHETVRKRLKEADAWHPDERKT